jgi:hypothetical protein
MLKIKFLFIAVIILSCSMFAQNLWTSETAINFIIPPGTKAASFVDANIGWDGENVPNMFMPVCYFNL